VKELEIPSEDSSNMVVTKSGDLLIIAQSESGELNFLNPSSGEVVYVFPVGGNPKKLALQSIDTLLAVADRKNGISILGIPGE